jgi:hypothetical protein
MRLALGLAIAATLLAAAPGDAQQQFLIPGTDRYFKVEWGVTYHPARGAVVSGYVHNSYGLAADNVRLLIEAVDDRGEVVATTIGYVLGAIPAGDRRYFQETIPRTVATYRVRVVLYEWMDRGGGS